MNPKIPPQEVEEDSAIDLDPELAKSPAPLERRPGQSLAEFEEMAQLMKRLVPVSIGLTKPQDWIEQGDKVYLQGTGVDRISGPWGLRFGKYTVTREDYPDGEFAYVVEGPVGSHRTGVVFENVVGGRSSRDPFFDRFDADRPGNWGDMKKEEKAAWKKEHRIPVDELNLRKAAVTNWETRGASKIAGLRGLTRADIEAQGVKGVKRIEYASGGKGGSTAPADLKAEQVKLANEVLKRVGGDASMAKEVMIEITANPSKGFKGFDTASKLTHDWQISAAFKALKNHSTFGDNAREPGDE